MTEVKAKDYNEEGRKDYQEWRDKTTFFKDDELVEALNRKDVILPATEGYRFKVLLTSEENLLDFICKFDNVTPWEDDEIIQLVITEDDEDYSVETETFQFEDDDEEVNNYCYPNPVEMEGKLFHFNGYFKDGERIQTTDLKWERFARKNIKIIKEYNYPIFVSYMVEEGFDRCGDYKVRMIDITELGNVKENRIFGD